MIMLLPLGLCPSIFTYKELLECSAPHMPFYLSLWYYYYG
jgi:hypothetical protein